MGLGLIQFDKPKWKALSMKSKWDILTAMRGPDLTGHVGKNLKWFTTAVLRHVMWPVFKAEGGSALVNTTLHGVVLPMSSLPVGMLGPFDAAHFLGHIHEAAQITGTPVLFVSAGTYWVGINQDTRVECLKTWLKANDSEALTKHLQALTGGFSESE